MMSEDKKPSEVKETLHPKKTLDLSESIISRIEIKRRQTSQDILGIYKIANPSQPDSKILLISMDEIYFESARTHAPFLSGALILISLNHEGNLSDEIHSRVEKFLNKYFYTLKYYIEPTNTNLKRKEIRNLNILETVNLCIYKILNNSNLQAINPDTTPKLFDLIQPYSPENLPPVTPQTKHEVRKVIEDPSMLILSLFQNLFIDNIINTYVLQKLEDYLSNNQTSFSKDIQFELQDKVSVTQFLYNSSPNQSISLLIVYLKQNISEITNLNLGQNHYTTDSQTQEPVNHEIDNNIEKPRTLKSVNLEDFPNIYAYFKLA